MQFYDLHRACRAGDLDEVRQHVVDASDWVNCAAFLGEKLVIACENGHREVAAILLDHGADVNHRLGWIGPPIWIASGQCHIAMVRLLVDRGADLNIKWRETTPLHVAAQYNRLGVLRTIVGSGRADVDKGWESPLHVASRKGSLRLIDYLVKSGADIDRLNPPYGTALITACKSCHVPCAAMLLDLGAHVDEGDRDGVSPLAAVCITQYSGATLEGRLAIAKMLLARGADVDKADKHGLTARGIARAAGDSLRALFESSRPPKTRRLVFWMLRVRLHVVDRRSCPPESARVKVIDEKYLCHHICKFLMPQGTVSPSHAANQERWRAYLNRPPPARKPAYVPSIARRSTEVIVTVAGVTPRSEAQFRAMLAPFTASPPCLAEEPDMVAIVAVPTSHVESLKAAARGLGVLVR